MKVYFERIIHRKSRLKYVGGGKEDLEDHLESRGSLKAVVVQQFSGKDFQETKSGLDKVFQVRANAQNFLKVAEQSVQSQKSSVNFFEIARVSDLGDDAFKEIAPVAREINSGNSLDNFNDLLAIRRVMSITYFLFIY